MLKDDQLKLVDENGHEIVYDVIMRFNNNETKKTYVIFKENGDNSKDVLELYALRYNPFEDNPIYENVDYEREWTIINKLLKEVQENLKYN